jgi:hypothetical protein
LKCQLPYLHRSIGDLCVDYVTRYGREGECWGDREKKNQCLLLLWNHLIALKLLSKLLLSLVSVKDGSSLISLFF